LVKRADKYARRRYGVGATVRQFEDWRDEGLVPGGIPHGVRRAVHPEWEWTPRHYRRALTICRLRGQGTKRHSDLRWQLWLHGADDLEWKDVHGSIVVEWHRRRVHARKRLHTSYDPRSGAPPTPAQIQVLRDRMLDGLSGQFASILGANALTMYAGSCFGMGGDQVAVAFTRAFGGADAPVPLTADDVAPFLGTMADPSEVDPNAEQSLQRARRKTFENVRTWMQSLPEELRAVRSVLAATASSHVRLDLVDELHDLYWRAPRSDADISMLVQMVHRAVQRGDQAEGLAWWATTGRDECLRAVLHGEAPPATPSWSDS
jgi:hypothetical protein